MGTRSDTVLRRLAFTLMFLGGAGVAVIRAAEMFWNRPSPRFWVSAFPLALILAGIAVFVFATRKTTPRPARRASSK